MLTHSQAKAQLAHGRNGRRKLANNTYLYPADVSDPRGAINVRLHWTDVVTLLPNGNAILRREGFKTMTTADRIERFTPCSEWVLPYPGRRESGDWTLRLRDGSPGGFFDGIRVNPEGVVLASDERKARRLYRERCDAMREHRREQARVRRVEKRERDLVAAAMPDLCAVVRACGGTVDEAGSLAARGAETHAGREAALSFAYAERGRLSTLSTWNRHLRREGAELAAWRAMEPDWREAQRLSDVLARLRPALEKMQVVAERAKRMTTIIAARPVRGMVAGVKSVDEEFRTGDRWGPSHRRWARYAPGETLAAFDWRPDPQCGHGLHFTTTPRHSTSLGGPGKRFVLCGSFGGHVPIGDKWKAPCCVVFRELTPAEVDDLNAGRVRVRELLIAEVS